MSWARKVICQPSIGHTHTALRASPLHPDRSTPSPPCAVPSLASPGLGLRPWERSVAAAEEFASFDWPLTTIPEVLRLLACRHISPTWLLLGEFTGAWAERVELDRGVTTLAVDRRQPLTQCIAYLGDFHDVLPLCYRGQLVQLVICRV
jgi:hypothetical protein